MLGANPLFMRWELLGPIFPLSKSAIRKRNECNVLPRQCSTGTESFIGSSWSLYTGPTYKTTRRYVLWFSNFASGTSSKGPMQQRRDILVTTDFPKFLSPETQNLETLSVIVCYRQPRCHGRLHIPFPNSQPKFYGVMHFMCTPTLSHVVTVYSQDKLHSIACTPLLGLNTHKVGWIIVERSLGSKTRRSPYHWWWYWQWASSGINLVANISYSFLYVNICPEWSHQIGRLTSNAIDIMVIKKFCELKGRNIGIVEKAKETRFGML